MYATTVMVMVAMATAQPWGGEQEPLTHNGTGGKEDSPYGGVHLLREGEEEIRATGGLWLREHRADAEQPMSPTRKDETRVRPLLMEEAANLQTANGCAQVRKGGGPHGTLEHSNGPPRGEEAANPRVQHSHASNGCDGDAG